MITIDVRDSVVVAAISGEIDMANTAAIEQSIAISVKSEHLGFVIDLSEVTYLDSAGIRMLYHLDERASGRQQQVAVVIPSGSAINRTLEAAGALGSLRIVATADEATDLVGRGV